MSDHNIKIFRLMGIAYIAITVIYINTLMACLAYLIFGIPVSSVIVAAVASAYLIEQYMFHLLCTQAPDIIRELDKGR